MANFKLEWRLDTKRVRAIYLNGEMIKTTNVKEADDLAALAGVKNSAPYTIKKSAGSAVGKGVEFTAKASNVVEVYEKSVSVNSKYVPVKNTKMTFNATSASTVKVKVEKRGLIMGLIKGKIKVTVKVKK